jgi:CubicO group peptidase (beta-lactamase class C family)
LNSPAYVPRQAKILPGYTVNGGDTVRRRFKRPMRLRLILLVVIVLLAASAAFLPGILKKGEEPSGGAVNAVASGDAFKGNEYHSEMYLKMDEYLKAYEGKGCFTGMVLIARGDEIILEKGYGMASYEYSVPNKPDTKFHLGSITKQFTSMAVMQLSEKGLLVVKDPLSKYIPDYPNGSKITIHQLLTHTSGIPDYINDDDTFWNISMYYHSIDSIIARFKNKKLEFKPGSKYGYSNSGYVYKKLDPTSLNCLKNPISSLM